MAKLRDLDERVIIQQSVSSTDAMGGTIKTQVASISRAAWIEWGAKPAFLAGRETGGNMGTAHIRYDSETKTIQAGQRMEVESRAIGTAPSRTYKIEAVIPYGRMDREWIKLPFSDLK